ncbi:hypothetical protein [Streptomyces sp. NPDC048157]|uniref:hypothetical protein n=1 Tax=Streptomyces sp. NPDC048157 TaxID=3365503 RepID=UPI0037114BA9
MSARRRTNRHTDRTANNRRYRVIFVWGSADMTSRTFDTYDRRWAVRYAKEKVSQGAKIVLIKKLSPQGDLRLVVDLSVIAKAVA